MGLGYVFQFCDRLEECRMCKMDGASLLAWIIVIVLISWGCDMFWRPPGTDSYVTRLSLFPDWGQIELQSLDVLFDWLASFRVCQIEEFVE